MTLLNQSSLTQNTNTGTIPMTATFKRKATASATESIDQTKSYSVYNLGPTEPITELLRPSEAWITRCKYGSEVLVTYGDSALPMIDIDCGDVTRNFLEGALAATELNLQLRVYKTAHGVRLLAESQVLKPDGAVIRVLAETMRCDPSYLNLCQVQNCYRARLTQKPEGAGAARVCEYLCTIGNAGIDEYLAPLIQLHDERTGALLESGVLG